MIDLTMKSVKDFVFTTAGKQLEDYKHSKSRGSFKKKIGGSAIEVAFGFLDYAPEDYQYRFSIIVYIAEIEKALKAFYAYSQLSETANWAAAFFEGDFLEEWRGKELKFRRNYYNEVRSVEDLRGKLTQSLSLMQEKAIPFANSICDLESFSSYCFDNRYQIVRNFADTTLFCSSLLAVYLKDKQSYYDLAAYLKEALNRQSEQGNNYTLLFSYLDKLNKFVTEN